MPATETHTVIPVPEASRRLDAGALLLDVRTAVEHREVHARGAILAPLQEPSEERCRQVASQAQGRGIVLICKSGSRAAQAAGRFHAAGIEGVCTVEGGTDAWLAAGLPADRDRSVMSLERQVRLVVGIVVLIFGGLTLFVDKWYVLGAMFMGAGLTFAAITNTCGMAMMLAKMPWNRASDCASGSCGVPNAKQGKA